MAELVTLARPYAKAAFEYARAEKALASWQTALAQTAAIAQDARVKAALSSPSVTAEDKAKIFVDLCGDELDGKQANFIYTLAEHGRIALLPQISKLFEQYKANQEKTIDVEIQTAFEIAPEFEKQLVDTLKAKLERDVSLQAVVDKSLIGGALIRAGDTVIDGSARGRLAKLAEALGR